MDNYYSLLGVEKNASLREIKKAFREKAKCLHPDIAGKTAESKMRRLLAAYKALSNPDRRFAYDRVYKRFASSFDYPAFLRERKTDPVSQSKLIFYLLLRNEMEFCPLEVWTENGGLKFSMEKYLDREDWMDCGFLLAEELDRHDRVYEAFFLLAGVIKEEKRQPYFKHFMEDVEIFLHKITKRVKAVADNEQYEACEEALWALGFYSKKESRKRQKLRAL